MCMARDNHRDSGGFELLLNLYTKCLSWTDGKSLRNVVKFDGNIALIGNQEVPVSKSHKNRVAEQLKQMFGGD